MSQGTVIDTVNTQVAEQRVSDEQSFQQLLTFYLGEEMFCLDIEPIKEIIEYGKLTHVPMVPDFVRGVINIRGQVVPVIDLPVRFGWESSPVSKRSCIVIVEIEHDSNALVIGVVIDTVNEVLDIASSDVGPAPSFGTKINTAFIKGMAKMNDEFVVILNPEKVLSVDELSDLNAMTD